MMSTIVEFDQNARRRPTVIDVARLAEVSTATVDRVLNGRSGVRSLTTARVLKAAADLGYLDPADERTLGVGAKGQIDFILPDGGNRYIAQLGRQIVALAPWFERLRLKPRVEFVRAFDPEALAKTITRCGRTADGVAFMAIEHPLVREAVADLAARGVPTATLISDIANAGRAAYFGLDNRAAGRMAGYLLARFIPQRPAKVAMIAGSRGYRAHGEREMGFLDILTELHPGIDVVDLREGQDDEGMNQRQMRTLLTQHPDLAGIYNIGGGATGIARALQAARRARDVVFVGHGLTADTRKLLMDGTMDAVITQSADDTVRRCATLFADVIAQRMPTAEPAPMRIEVVFRENLPAPMG